MTRLLSAHAGVSALTLQLYKTYVRVSSDLSEPPPLPGSPRSTVSPPPGGYSSHTSSASESEALTSAGLAHGLGGFSSAGGVVHLIDCIYRPWRSFKYPAHLRVWRSVFASPSP